jgi:FkbM family methyltransferase
MSYSQLNQDNNVLEFFNHKKNLYFLDIGANDGISLSNTYKLEKGYNWKGICSEPLPRLYNDLKKYRNVHIDTNAVYSKSGLTLDFIVADDHMLSGITDCIGAHKDNIGNNKKNIKVKTITLDKLLKKYKSPKIIHYMSLDTEGSEHEILKSVNYKNNKFLYINVEHNYEEPKRTEIRKLLENNGYLYKGENYFDDDYIHYSTITGTYYFNNDYTRPIKIMRKSKNKFIVSSDYWENDNGEFKEGTLQFKNLNLKGNIFYDRIEFGGNNNWHKKQKIKI